MVLITKLSEFSMPGMPVRSLRQSQRSFCIGLKRPIPMGTQSRNLGACLEVLPYMHCNLKKAASRHDVPVVFSGPHKLVRLCSKISSDKKKAGGCGMNHELPLVDCVIGVVYEIPLSCSK